MESESDIPAAVTPVGSQNESRSTTTRSQGYVLLALTLHDCAYYTTLVCNTIKL